MKNFFLSIGLLVGITVILAFATTPKQTNSISIEKPTFDTSKPKPPNIYKLNEDLVINLSDAINVAKANLQNSTIPANQMKLVFAIFDSVQVNFKKQFDIFHPEINKPNNK